MAPDKCYFTVCYGANLEIFLSCIFVQKWLAWKGLAGKALPQDGSRTEARAERVSGRKRPEQKNGRAFSGCKAEGIQGSGRHRHSGRGFAQITSGVQEAESP